MSNNPTPLSDSRREFKKSKSNEYLVMALKKLWLMKLVAEFEALDNEQSIVNEKNRESTTTDKAGENCVFLESLSFQ